MKISTSVYTLFAVLAATTAQASDLPSRKAPPSYVSAPSFSWTGLYAGVNVGAGWRNSGSSKIGILGGGQIGYNYQLSPLFVVGAEADFQGTSIGSGGVSRLPWFGTVRGRLGFTPFDPHLLMYGTGGFAYGETDHNGFQGRITQTRVGWTAGAGVEWAFAPSWSAKVEYLYTDLGADRWAGAGGWLPQTHHTGFNTVRAGVNYHFNMFASAAPVFAKY